MSARSRALQLAGVSVLTLVSVMAIGSSVARADCAGQANTTTTPGAGGPDTVTTNAVDVTCEEDISPEPVATLPFSTQFTGTTTAGFTFQNYDGNGNDELTINGGAINSSGGNLPTVTVTGDDGDFTFDYFATLQSADSVSTLGGNDVVTMSGGFIGDAENSDFIDLDLGEGDDEFDMSGGLIYGSVLGGGGNDEISIYGTGEVAFDIVTGLGNDIVTIGEAAPPAVPGAGGTVGGGIFTDEGNDQVFIHQGSVGFVILGDGADRLEMTGGTIEDFIAGGGGIDTIVVNGGVVSGSIFTGDDGDNVTIEGDAAIGLSSGEGPIFDSVGLEDGNDIFRLGGTATLEAAVSGGLGDDQITIAGGSVGTFVAGNDGTDRIIISAGQIGGDVLGGLGDDTIQLSGTGTVNGFISGDEGNDTVRILGGIVQSGVDLGAGADQFIMSGGTVTGSVFGLGGGNTFVVSGGSITGSLFAGSESDQVTISGGAQIGLSGGEGIVDSVGLEGGDDTFVMNGGTLAGAVSGGDGADQLAINGGTVGTFVAGNGGSDEITVAGGSIGGDVTGGDGDDTVNVSGGTINGNIDAESVTLSGGTILGDITGLSANTLIIQNATTLNLSDGVLFSGTNAVGNITATNLAQGGSRHQVFSGFTTVSASNSQLAFATGNQGIATFNLTNGSTLFIHGNANLLGTANINGSTINLNDGFTDDIFTLGGINLTNATIAIDVNQQTLTSDQLVANAFAATGTNTILVNLLGTPQFTEATDIPIILAPGLSPSTFVVAGIPGTPGALFSYTLVSGPGGLILRATPVATELALATQNAIDVGTVDTAIDALYGINDDALDADLGLANGGAMVQLTDTFGVFASGQLARVNHDGFSVTSNGITGAGPSFDATDFSAAISFDWNAAKYFQFDNQYGLNIGLFAGYASTDVELGPFAGFSEIGEGNNESGMFGGYALFRQGYNYILVSGSAYLGETDVTNNVLGSSGSYDTEGYAVTASGGRIFVLSDRMRFDLRGGILGVTFSGGDYVDSGGNVFGDSEISFGALKFEPGIYGDFQMENGMIFSPYARGELQQRFAYDNTADIDGQEVEFDDSDFSAALSAGFNLKMSTSTTVSGEVRGKASSDSSTFAGKLGVKIAF